MHNTEYTQLRNMQQYHVYVRSADLVHMKKVQGKKVVWQFTMISDESVEL